MSEKYIRQNRNSFSVVFKSHNYGTFKNLEHAILIRDYLYEHEWNTESIKDDVIKLNNRFIIIKVIDEKVHILAELESKPTEKLIAQITRKYLRNPNNSKYGLNISKIFETYIIKKQIAGDEYIFGYYDNLTDCEFVRNFLLENEWDVLKFKNIEFDEDTQTYKVILVIDDKVYVLNSHDNNNIDLNQEYSEFLLKISKHKLGLVNYPHLDELKDKVDDLKNQLDVNISDENWDLRDVSENTDTLNDIIFNLTPWQKTVYDSFDTKATFDEIKKSLIRYKSGNFDKKIKKNLDELTDLKLIRKNKDVYEKIN